MRYDASVEAHLALRGRDANTSQKPRNSRVIIDVLLELSGWLVTCAFSDRCGIYKRALTYVKDEDSLFLEGCRSGALRYRAPSMTRPKTITDEEILAVAREVFLTKGHAAATREIAVAAGISEGVLYQRFGSKNELFFASMSPSAPDVEKLLGPEPPQGEALAFVKGVLLRLSAHFAEVIPLALHVMTHPSFDPTSLGKAIATATRLQEGLARRLAWFESKKRLRKSTAETTARLLVSLAHDSAVTGQSRSPAQRIADMDALATLVWNGIAPTERTTVAARG